MRKILALVLMVVLSLSIIGCTKAAPVLPKNPINNSVNETIENSDVPEQTENNVGVTSSNEILANDLKFFEGENLLGVVVTDFLIRAEKDTSVEIIFEDELTKDLIQDNEFYNIIFSDEVTHENHKVVTISKYKDLQVSGE